MNAVLPGSFDPITAGHYDIATRAARHFDSVTVLVVNNTGKKYMFPFEARVNAAKAAFEGCRGINVASSEGMLCDFIIKNKIGCIIKGVRNPLDFDYENQLYQINNKLCGVDTVLYPAAPELSYISSTFVRDIIKYGKDFSPYVPVNTIEFFKNILRKS
ncbi:MAG: pantetheine-phosphate adenylyltransferase [Oscillospiraceae bacterium]|nr:pantetheine-phosphate adenylyltransferase [Oscillospiraceae bacterium]